jgi:hypothetical protein
MFRRKTGNPSQSHIGNLIMKRVELAPTLIDLKNLKPLLTQENFQNYKVLKMVYNIQIVFYFWTLTIV